MTNPASRRDGQGPGPVDHCLNSLASDPESVALGGRAREFGRRSNGGGARGRPGQRRCRSVSGTGSAWPWQHWHSGCVAESGPRACGRGDPVSPGPALEAVLGLRLRRAPAGRRPGRPWPPRLESSVNWFITFRLYNFCRKLRLLAIFSAIFTGML